MLKQLMLVLVVCGTYGKALAEGSGNDTHEHEKSCVLSILNSEILSDGYFAFDDQHAYHLATNIFVAPGPILLMSGPPSSLALRGEGKRGTRNSRVYVAVRAISTCNTLEMDFEDRSYYREDGSPASRDHDTLHLVAKVTQSGYGEFAKPALQATLSYVPTGKPPKVIGDVLFENTVLLKRRTIIAAANMESLIDESSRDICLVVLRNNGGEADVPVEALEKCEIGMSGESDDVVIAMRKTFNKKPKGTVTNGDKAKPEP